MKLGLENIVKILLVVWIGSYVAREAATRTGNAGLLRFIG